MPQPEGHRAACHYSDLKSLVGVLELGDRLVMDTNPGAVPRKQMASRRLGTPWEAASPPPPFLGP